MRLAQVSNVGEFERGTAALSRMLEDPWIAFLDGASAFELEPTDYDYRPITGTTTVQTRGAGGSYTSTDEAPDDRLTGALAFHGDSQDVDISYIEDDKRGLRDLGGWLDKRIGKKFKSWRNGLVGLSFNGTGAGTPRQMTGLKTIYNGSSNLPGFGITGVIDAASYASGAPNSLDLSDPDNWNIFVRIMDFAIAQVENPLGIPLNKEMYATVRMIAREKNLLGTTRNHLDQPLETWGTTPLIRMVDGAITNTEPDNAGVPVNETSSIYVLSPGEGRIAVVTNSGLYWHEKDHQEGKESGRIEWEMRLENKVEEENAGRRVRNLKPA